MTLYFLLFLILHIKIQILQRKKRHYSRILLRHCSRILLSLPTTPPYLWTFFVVSITTPQSTKLFSQLPFYLLECTHQSSTCLTYLDPILRASKSFQFSEQELCRNIFRSLELLSKLRQCKHSLRKYLFPSVKILILFLRKSYSFLYQSLNCQLQDLPLASSNMQPSGHSGVKFSHDASKQLRSKYNLK